MTSPSPLGGTLRRDDGGRGDGGSGDSGRGGGGIGDGGDRGAAGREDRGQTTIDYAIGISVFLLAVAFVFGFVPSLVTPFTADATEAVVVADRSADRLAGDLLVADPARPTVLNATCTAGFFDADGPAPAGCRYGTDADDLGGALGVSTAVRSLNATVTDDGGVVDLDGTRLAAGPAPPRGASVSVARRTVLLDGRERTLAVRVW